LRWQARLAKIASFKPGDWSMLAESIVTLLVVQVALHVVEFPRLLSWATRMTVRHDAEASRAHIERTAWLVTLGGRVMRLKCLTRSLALVRVLARRGVATDIRIGVRTQDAKLQAHAWVESRGRVLNDDPLSIQRFAPFDRALGAVSNA
jgi:hypothetical protein